MRVLASTTRQWNPGDEFILWGCKKIMNLDHVVIYDRNPDLHNKSTFSNSWRGESLEIFDYVLIAGTPEWSGDRLRILYNNVKKYQKPIYFLGIGCHEGRRALSQLDRKILSQAKLITVRDGITKQKIESVLNKNIEILPCPALFATESIEKKERIKKIGIVIQIPNANVHSIWQKTYDDITNLIKKIKKKYEIILISHYLKELYSESWNEFESPVYYSYRAEDYPEIYSKCDFIFSTRLHGTLLAASLEIPTALINPMRRCETAINQIPFIKKIKDIDTVELMLDNWNMNEWYKNIRRKKDETWTKYKELIIRSHPTYFS